MAREKGTLLPGRVKAPELKLSATGRPRKKAPPDAAEVIRLATSTGASKIGTAMALGVSYDVLVRWLDESPELKAAFDEGREKERASLHNVLYEAAMAGAVVPALFLLKAKHGYLEGQQEGQANRVSVTFNIPGAMPLDKYTVIENVSDH